MRARQRAVVDRLRSPRICEFGMTISSFFDRAQVRHLEPRLDHVADGVADLDAIADLERAPIRHHVAGDDVGDRRRRAEREHDADEQRDALERGRLRAGDVRIGDDRGRSDDRDADDLVGRLRPFGSKFASVTVPRPTASKKRRITCSASRTRRTARPGRPGSGCARRPLADHLQRTEREADACRATGRASRGIARARNQT